MTKTLYRSNKDKMIAGICGGLSDYFDMDPTIVRILWVVFTFATNGAGIIAYIVGMFIIPKKPYEFQTHSNNEGGEHMNDKYTNSNSERETSHNVNEGNYVNDKKHSSKLAGVILIMIGAYFLLREFFAWIDFSYVWPVMIIIVGVMVIFKDRG